VTDTTAYTHVGHTAETGHVHSGRLYGHRDYRGVVHALADDRGNGQSWDFDPSNHFSGSQTGSFNGVGGLLRRLCPTGPRILPAEAVFKKSRNCGCFAVQSRFEFVIAP